MHFICTYNRSTHTHTHYLRNAQKSFAVCCQSKNYDNICFVCFTVPPPRTLWMRIKNICFPVYFVDETTNRLTKWHNSPINQQWLSATRTPGEINIHTFWCEWRKNATTNERKSKCNEQQTHTHTKIEKERNSFGFLVIQKNFKYIVSTR